MNFYHVPSFEDNFTMKIWLKNWNLKINKAFFMTVHNLNNYFNSKLTVELLRARISPQVLNELFPFHKWPEESLKFHLYLKDDYDLKEEIGAHFYRKMHFLVFMVIVESSEEEEIKEVQQSLKKFAFLSSITATITLIICKTQAARDSFKTFSNCVVVSDLRELNEECFDKKILPIFIDSLSEKLKDIPLLDKNRVFASQEDFAMMIRKKIGNSSEAKLMKLRGDIALIFNSLQDALNYFQKAREIFIQEKKNISDRKTVEFAKIWIAGIQESIAACHYYQIKRGLMNSQMAKKDLEPLIAELIRNCNESLAIYDQEQKKTFYYELLLKMIAIFSLLKDKAQFIDFFFKLRNINSQVNFDPRIYLYIGDLAYNAGLNRIAICALFECSRQAKKGGELEGIRTGCLNLCAQILKLDLENYLNNFRMIELLPAEITYLLLIGLLDVNLHSHNNIKTLHYYLLLMKKFEKNDWVFKEITQTIHWEYPLYENEYDILPFVQRIVPIAKPKLFQRINDNTVKHETERSKISESVFIYDPRTKNRFIDLNWIAQEEAEIIVYFTNPLGLYVIIDSITLETDGVDTANYSNQINLSPYTRNYEYKFKIRPVQSGILKIKGIKVRIGNLIYLNTVDQRGVSTIYKYVKSENPYIYEKFYSSNEVDLFKIPIAESVPCLNIAQRNYIPETIFYNENLQLEYRIANFSKIKAEDIRVSLKIDYENAYTVSVEKFLSNFEIESNKFFDINFVLFQGKFAKSDNFAFSDITKNRLDIEYKNRNIIERVYKITLRIESRFNTNRDYIGVKEYVRFFKNYRLFEARPTIIDFYGISNLEFHDDYKYKDISDEIHMYFEVNIKFSNITNENITVALKSKDDDRLIEKITLVDKNVLKFTDLKQNLQQLQNLNQKYELVWELKENKREGIIQYDYPIIFAVA